MLLMMQAAETVFALTSVGDLSAWLVLGFLGLVGVAILYYVFTGKIDLSGLISEPSGEASMSRFQLLVFTFVIAACLFLITASRTPPNFPEVIPQGILVLLGISSSSYLVSKGIQASSKQGLGPQDPTLIIEGSAKTTSLGGPPIQFQVKATGLSDETVIWSLDPAEGRGTIDASGLYRPPSENQADASGKKVVIQAASTEDVSVKDTETIELT